MPKPTTSDDSLLAESLAESEVREREERLIVKRRARIESHARPILALPRDELVDIVALIVKALKKKAPPEPRKRATKKHGRARGRPAKKRSVARGRGYLPYPLVGEPRAGTKVALAAAYVRQHPEGVRAVDVAHAVGSLPENISGTIRNLEKREIIVQRGLLWFPVTKSAGAESVAPPSGEPKQIDAIEAFVHANPQGVRTLEIARTMGQSNSSVHGLLKFLQRKGRVERHGERTNTLWTLPGVVPVPRVDTIAAAIQHVLGESSESIGSRELRETAAKLVEETTGKRPRAQSVHTELSKLVAKGLVATDEPNERGARYRAPAEKGPETPTLN